MSEKIKETKKPVPFNSFNFVLGLSVLAIIMHLDPMVDWIIPLIGVIFATRAILKGISKWMVLLLCINALVIAFDLFRLVAVLVQIFQ